MFAILKDPNGIPVALFEIEKETAKRYYGKIVDNMERENWFWLTGLTTARLDRQAHCDKSIVLALVRTENAWFQIKDDLKAVKKDFMFHSAAIEHALSEARATCRRDQEAVRKHAQDSIDAYLVGVRV